MLGTRKKLVMCQACRGLIDPSARTCPLCGRDAVPAPRLQIGDQSGSPHFVSRLFFSINIVLFVLMAFVQMKTGGGKVESFFEPANHMILTDFGSCVPSLIREGELWRLVTPNFLHLGLIHLALNSIILF